MPTPNSKSKSKKVPPNQPPLTAWKQKLLETNERWNPGSTEREHKHNKAYASGTGFGTADKATKKVHPELAKLADETGLSPKDIVLLISLFPPQGE
jgi:hypothetical protein